MQVVFQKGSLTAASCQDVVRVVVYPEGGRGSVHLYNDAGRVVSMILLDTIQAAIFTNDANLTVEQLALLPEPIIKKDDMK